MAVKGSVNIKGSLWVIYMLSSIIVTVSAKNTTCSHNLKTFYSLIIIGSVQGMDHQSFSLLWYVVLKL